MTHQIISNTYPYYYDTPTHNKSGRINPRKFLSTNEKLDFADQWEYVYVNHRISKLS